MNIVLTGYRGAGKTTVGKILSRKLNRKLIDTDKEVEKRIGMKIPDIVRRHGWNRFRKMEKAAIHAALKKKRVIIATGAGGLIENSIPRKELKKNAIVALLTADAKELALRLKGSDRPSLTGKGAVEEIKSVLRKRKKRYFELADLLVDTTDITAQEVAKLIIKYRQS